MAGMIIRLGILGLLLCLSGGTNQDSHALSLEQVNTTSPQELSNKTLVSPTLLGVISGSGTYVHPTFSGTILGNYTLSGTPTLDAHLGISTGRIIVAGANILLGSPLADRLNAQHLAIQGQSIGDLLVANTAGSFTRLAAVADGNVLRSAGTGVLPVYGKVRLSGSPNDVSGTLTPGNGGTGVSTSPANGQVLIGNGSGYTQATLTAGPGVSITNGAGSITLGAPFALTGFHRLTCQNTAAALTTKFECLPAIAVLTTASGNRVRITSPGTLQCDLSLAGPIANGRDQAGAFSGDTWVTFWAIYNGTTTACLASTTINFVTGPTLPSGYTHYAYMTSVRLDNLGQLKRILTRGNKNFYLFPESLYSIGAIGTNTFGVGTLIPADYAHEAEYEVFWTVTSNGSGGTGVSVQIGPNLDASIVTGKSTYVNAASQTVQDVFHWTTVGDVSLRIVTTEFLNPANRNSLSGTVKAISYTVPNGAA